MYFLLMVRSIDRWRPNPDNWPGDQAPADVMGDLRTSENKLSVYLVDEERQRETLVCFALAATRTLQKLDYIMFRPSIVEGLGLSAKEAPGDVPSDDAASWHQDIIIHTACNLARLADRIWASNEFVRERLTKREVEEGIRKGVTTGKLDRDHVKFNKELHCKLKL